MKRTILFHYHLFKNAGTSVDQILKRNFGARWVSREFEGRRNRESHLREITQWVQAHPEAQAFSSHTLDLPPPVVPGVEIFPVLFVRHPLDRIASAYAFEKRQGGGGFGAVLARNTSFGGYVEVRLSMPGDRQCRNFHTDRFARMLTADAGNELSRSLAALDLLPFVGLVEQFSASMARLARLLQPAFPGFQAFEVSANMSRKAESTFESRMAAFQEELGAPLFDRLMAANEDDLALHTAVRSRLDGLDGGT